MITLMLIAGLIGAVAIHRPVQVEAAGSEEIEIATSSYACYYYNYPNGTSWANIRSGSVGTWMYVSNARTKLYADDSSNLWRELHRGLFQFDLSGEGIESLDDIISVNLEWTASSEDNTFTDPFYASLYSYDADGQTNGVGGAVVEADWDCFQTGGTNRISEVLDLSDFPASGSFDIEIDEDYWDDIFWLDDDYAYVAMLTEYDSLNVSPTWESTCYMQVTGTAKLIVEYMAAAAERDPDAYTNGSIDTTTDGSEEADSISWYTPRCAYADEDIIIEVAGDSGAAISLVMEDINGTVLADHTDSIRDTGTYGWTVNLSDSASKYIRVYEENFNLTGTWGAVRPRPDLTQENCTTYAKYTYDPQYENEMWDYQVDAEDVMTLNYKTNLEDTDLVDYSLELWYRGDSGDVTWSENLDDLDTEYFECDSSHKDMLHWRYILAVMDGSGESFDDLDGLLIDLAQDYAWDTAGWYQFLVYEDGVGEMTTTHNCYWYYPTKSDGLEIALDRNNYVAGSTITVSMHVGDLCYIQDDLSDVNIAVVRTDTDAVMYDTDETISGEDNIFTITAPVGAFEYILRCTFTGDGSYNHVHDRYFTVGGAGSTGIVGEVTGLFGGLTNAMQTWGIDNPAGHWLLMLGLMILVFWIFRRSKLMRVVGPLSVLALGITLSWVETWLIVLLSLSVGFVMWKILGRHLTGGKA